VATIAWTALVAGVLGVSLARSSPAGRWIAAPVLVPCAAALVLYGAQAAHGLGRGFLSNDPTDRTLWAAQLIAIAAAAIGVGAAPLYRRRTRSALARLVLELGATPSAGGLRERLAQAFGDPDLQLLHAREDGQGWLDAQGRPAEPAAGHDVTRVVAHGHPVSALVHRPRLMDNPALAAEIARTARLALEHERLHALHRAHLTQLRASRARLVVTADDERRQLERDLHDGAQQRLVTLAIETRLARRRNPALDAALAPVEEDLRTALGELRDLARGLYPAVLAAEGLAAALETLAEDDVRLTLGTLTEDRFPEAAESAAYFLVAETLRHGPVQIDTLVERERLVVDARGPAPRSPRIEDRVLAAGGTFTAAAGRIRAELPCVS
jgi:signal transduction histidine kinase